VLIIESPSFLHDFFKGTKLALWPFQGQSLPSHEAANGSATAGLPVFFSVLRWGDFFWFHFHNGGSLVKYVFCFFFMDAGKKWTIDKVGPPQDRLWLLKDKDEKSLITHLGFYMDLINIFFVGIQPFSQSFGIYIIVSILNTLFDMFFCI
jgi:hypothetical protein